MVESQNWQEERGKQLTEYIGLIALLWCSETCQTSDSLRIQTWQKLLK
jgi:hypothetical protein